MLQILLLSQFLHAQVCDFCKSEVKVLQLGKFSELLQPFVTDCSRIEAKRLQILEICKVL